MGGRGQERWGGKGSGLMKQVCLGFTNTHSMPTPSGATLRTPIATVDNSCKFQYTVKLTIL